MMPLCLERLEVVSGDNGCCPPVLFDVSTTTSETTSLCSAWAIEVEAVGAIAGMGLLDRSRVAISRASSSSFPTTKSSERRGVLVLGEVPFAKSSNSLFLLELDRVGLGFLVLRANWGSKSSFLDLFQFALTDTEPLDPYQNWSGKAP